MNGPALILHALCAAVDRLLRRWQELYIWLPLLLGLLYAAYRIIPQLDPQAGIDGWGALWGMLMVVLAAVIAGFLAWLFEVTYSREISDAEERELTDHACGIDRSDQAGQRIGAGPATWQAVAVLALYRLRWLVLWLALFWRLSGG